MLGWWYLEGLTDTGLGAADAGRGYVCDQLVHVEVSAT